MEKSGLNSTSHGVRSGDDNWWLRFLSRLDKATGDRKWRITVVLAGFVLIKVIWIAHGNIQVALTVFNSAGVVTVITGGILSAFPLVSAVALAFVIFVLVNRQFIRQREIAQDHERTATELSKIESNKVHSEEPARRSGTNSTAYEKLIWFTGLSAVVGCFFLTPWPIVVASALLGTASGLAAQIKGKRTLKTSLVGFILLLTIGLVLNPLLYAVWLPHEMLTVPKLRTNPDGEYVFGYVLSDSNGWISVLQTGERDILRFKSGEVASRALCHGQTAPIPIPHFHVPQEYKSADPLSRWILGPGTTIPPCDPPQVHTIGTPICISSLTNGLTCNGQAAELGNGPLAAFLAADSVTATYMCQNHAGNITPGQTVVEQNATGLAQTITPHNRKVTFSLSIPPPTTPSQATKCPNGNWPVVSASLTYTNVVLHIQQQRGTDVLTHSFGDIDPADRPTPSAARVTN